MIFCIDYKTINENFKKQFYLKIKTENL